MTDEMYTTKQAALYLGVTEADIRNTVREGKLRAWSLPLRKGLLVRKADLMRFREPSGRNSISRQLSLFTADTHEQEAPQADTSAA
ncbi:MAG TPA: helix-turn-helix domain-containing protein [Chloroflexia bacterium]|nr:helix-turn-helix domain-containing protein [Chloroflexia bacterium]